MQTEAEIASFIIKAGWEGSQRKEITADFSTRRYARLIRAGKKPESAILMRADPGQKTDIFIHLDFLLRRLEISAPEIYESDEGRSLVLMEDFGLHTCGQLLEEGANRDPFDQAAAGILARLHQAFKPSMLGATKAPLFNAALFTDQATLFLDHYFPQIFRRQPTAMERSGFVEAWHTALSPLDALPRTLLLRDFMPDNAMKLAAPAFGFSIGILDFQDAGLGPVAYDIGSWCENCRREGGMERLDSFIGLYCALNPEVDSQTLFAAARVFLAQRYTRFLGILVRQERMDDTPRVWSALKLLLKDEKLSSVRRWFASIAPPS